MGVYEINKLMKINEYTRIWTDFNCTINKYLQINHSGLVIGRSVGLCTFNPTTEDVKYVSVMA